MTVRAWFRGMRPTLLARSDAFYFDLWTVTGQVIAHTPLDPVIRLGPFRLIFGQAAWEKWEREERKIEAVQHILLRHLLERALGDLDTERRRRAVVRGLTE